MSVLLREPHSFEGFRLAHVEPPVEPEMVLVHIPPLAIASLRSDRAMGTSTSVLRALAS